MSLSRILGTRLAGAADIKNVERYTHKKLIVCFYELVHQIINKQHSLSKHILWLANGSG